MEKALLGLSTVKQQIADFIAARVRITATEMASALGLTYRAALQEKRRSRWCNHTGTMADL